MYVVLFNRTPLLKSDVVEHHSLFASVNSLEIRLFTHEIKGAPKGC